LKIGSGAFVVQTVTAEIMQFRRAVHGAG
jgi:hypothetical protein